MKFNSIYDKAIRYWPNEIEIDDGFPIGPSGFRFPKLTNIWDQVEDSVESDDHWTELTVWCMYQAFHSASRRLVESGDNILRTRQVPKSEIESFISENLKVKGWAEYRLKYENDLV